MGRLRHPRDAQTGPATLAALAAQQMGIVTRTQLAALGVRRGSVEKALRAGRLHRIFRGVYAVGHAGLTREAWWLAAVLACGPGAVLSHLSAALLWGIVVAEGRTIEISAARSRQGQPGITVHRPRQPPAWTNHLGIPVATPEQTLIHLARTFTTANLERAVGEAQLIPGFDATTLPPRIRTLAEDPDHGISRNVMERRFRKLACEAGLSAPEVNAPWGRWEIDFLFREEGVAIETDGRATHERRLQFERDRAKDRDLQLAGLLALRFTYLEIMRRPQVVRDTLSRAAAQR